MAYTDPGSQGSRNSSALRYSAGVSSPPAKQRMAGSSMRLISVAIGYAPSTSTAQLSTVPPQSKQKGGVSDQPPPRSMRGGAETSTRSNCHGDGARSASAVEPARTAS